MVPTVQHPEQDATDRRAKAAYLGRRCGQIVLDALLLWLVCLLQMPLAAVIALPLHGLGVPLAPAFVSGFSVYFALVLAENWWWHVWVPYRRGGSTFVMRWLELRIIGLDGEPARLGQHNARWLLVSADAMFFGLVGLVLMTVTPQHQRLGDIVARTHVVRIQAAAEPGRGEADPGGAEQDETGRGVAGQGETARSGAARSGVAHVAVHGDAVRSGAARADLQGDAAGGGPAQGDAAGNDVALGDVVRGGAAQGGGIQGGGVQGGAARAAEVPSEAGRDAASRPDAGTSLS
ncbi:RDD family protein [Saccharopolyspora gregorii]|uniref:RDD domain-containing protein n=1 Tax=Saccharopolyspora gregorii TaxID=33914 RepID=A0ABP6RX76_9PSEU|nr:RDD family protein [Saccharopolyspora gregorii]